MKHAQSIPHAFILNFLGHAPPWYKQIIITFLILNPVLMLFAGPFVTGWFLIAEFIFTLAMALKCYPLQPGGLLAIEAVLLGLTNSEAVKDEVFSNFPVILLLMFMVAGIYFMKPLLLFVFTRLLLRIHSKIALSLLFCMTAAFLSAFLDALTVTAVIIAVAMGFYNVYHKVASGMHFEHDDDHDNISDHSIEPIHRNDLDEFRAFLRSLMMHAAVGTALGGVCTTVGEPQNLLIAGQAQWSFAEFFIRMAPVTMPVLVCGLFTCVLVEKFAWFDYGGKLPERVRTVLVDYAAHRDERRTHKDVAALYIQAACAVLLIFGLAFHIAEVGLVGLMIIVLQTSFNGVIDEHSLGKSFEEALPFTALLVVFFTVVSVIHQQHLFHPLIAAVLHMDTDIQPQMFFLANGVLSAISDNVFVATIYINEVKDALIKGEISREHFNHLTVAINTGTNLPSVATPNGQAAFLFLLTSALAPLIRLSYGKMVWMALPYTVVMTSIGFLAVTLAL